MNIEIDATAPITVTLPLHAAIAIHKLLGALCTEEVLNKGLTREQDMAISAFYWTAKEKIKALNGAE